MKRVLLALALLCLLAAPAQAAPTGTISLNQPSPAWGDTITFDVAHGALKNRERVYVTVICFQDDELVLQYSTREDLGWAVPLAQTDGGAAVGMVIDPTQPGDCEAHLIHRVTRRGEDTITTLDVVSFIVSPG